MFAKHYAKEEGEHGSIGVISLSELKGSFPSLAEHHSHLWSFSTMWIQFSAPGDSP